MRTRDHSIQLATLCAGTAIIFAATVPDVIGMGRPGFDAVQLLAMAIGIFLCSVGWLRRMIPGTALLAIGTILFATLVGSLIAGWFGLDMARHARQVTLNVRQELAGPDPIGIFQPDSRLGWRHKKNVVGHHQTLDFNVEYTIDSEGFRSIPNSAKPRGTVLFLGCSYTFGQGVADDECYPAILAQQYWQNYTVRNHSSMGWGTVQAYLDLRDQLSRRQLPKLVIYAWISHHAMRNYLRKTQLLEVESSQLKTPLFALEGGKLVDKGLVGPEAGLPDSPALLQSEIEVSIRLIAEMNDRCREKHVPFVVVALPDPYARVDINRAVFDGLRLQQIETIDAWEPRDDYFKSDRHPQPSWHAALAKRLADHPVIKALIEK